MPIVDYWKLAVVSRYAKFDGRANRAEYWWFALANAIVQIVLFALSRAATIFLVLYLAYALALLIPSIAVGIRRLHDTNRSGWWLLISLVPCVGLIVLILVFATQGDTRPNRYGTGSDHPTPVA